MISRLRLLLRGSTPPVLLIPVCGIFFLLIVAFGNPPQALGLDPAWTEVQAWGFMNHAQWGPDFINTYGPLGFLHPFSAYVSGIFPAFATGQIVLSAIFAVLLALMFHRAPLGEFALFALVFLCWSFKLIGEVSWLLTLPFASVWLINCAHDNRDRAGYFALIVLAPIFSAIALTKFTIFPIWTACVIATSCVWLLERNWRLALLIPVVFVAGLIIAWSACGQAVLNLPLYLWSGFETARGYRHAQGILSPPAVEAAGLVVLFGFAVACAYAAWRVRHRFAAVVSIGLIAAIAALFWLAYFTRADEFHWPSFFAAMALLPFALLRNRYVARSGAVRTALIGVILASGLMAFAQTSPDAVAPRAIQRMQSSLHDLTHLSELYSQRESQWQAAANAAALPRIQQRVGHARIDMVTWQQGVVLLNRLTYAPRPVFQSHIAATPQLARLNEAYFLGPRAPEFVLFQLSNMDDRFPMSEDNLAMLALLRRYRPVLFENGYLLLQLDTSITNVTAVATVTPAVPARLGDEVAMETADGPAVGFIDIELNWLGKLYTLLFPEPALQITVRTGDGETVRQRLVRLTAPSGFLIDPLVRSTHDWLDLYFSKTLPRVQSLRIDAALPWARSLFRRDFTLSRRSIEILQADSSATSADLLSALYPGFNSTPVAPANLRVVVEDDKDVIFLHAPASMLFEPAPGRYRISATFGIQRAALNSPDCAEAGADGIGASIILRHADRESIVAHIEIDPFQAMEDRGPHRLRTQNVDVGAGDRIEYRVDPGRRGNASCDWSYVRDFVFRPGGRSRTVVDPREYIFDDDFE